MTHQPKGGMCANCKRKLQNCSKLQFKTMPVLKIDGDAKIVLCTNFSRFSK